MGKTTRQWTLSAVAADDTGETAWIDPAPGESQIIAFQIEDGGSWSGTLTFQQTIDGDLVVSALCLPTDSTTASSTQSAADAIYYVDSSGGRRTRVKATVVSGGSVIVTPGVG